MTVYSTSRSDAMMRRAREVIPGGIFGHYGASYYEGAPAFCARADGACIWDVDGNRYIDYMCAFGPNILGCHHPRVDEAVRDQSRQADTASLASPVMVDLAEQLVETVAIADWALFGKNGADATGLSVMIARAATGREKIVRVEGGYHGTAAWMKDGAPGTISDDGAHVHSVSWNDVAALKRLVEANPGGIACFIASPYHHPTLHDNEMPADGYWRQVEAICRQGGIVLILDDVRTGFRIDLAGSNVAYGFEPDLICFGKALGNGYPISALAGTDALRQTAQDVFYTGTQFYSGAPMAAALATINLLHETDAVSRMAALGKSLSEGLIDVAASHDRKLVVSGVPSMPYFRLAGVDFETHARWIRECVRRGAYLLSYHNHFLSMAHTQADLARTWQIADAAFKALADRPLGVEETVVES